MKVTVLGTGIMGTGVVHSLLREGHTVTAWNRTASKAQALADDGASVAGSVAEAVAGAEVVILTLFDADSVLAALDEIADATADAPEHAGEPVVVQASTIGVEGTRAAAARAAQAQLPFVEAMMLGTRAPAENGQLVLLTAGDPSLLRRVGPALEAISSRRVSAGDDLGAATSVKLVCNAWVASVTAAVAQSVALAQGLGVDPALFLEAIEGGAVDTPYAHVKGKAMMSGDWTPSFALDGVRKDLGVITDAATGSGVDTTVLDALRAVFATASEAGHGADDMAAVLTAFTAGRGR
ncbi:MAG: NAD(P)-dependent oxidoreductase [Actinomycetota bacterium]|nr:NAD(P)-dependent oxidoreductase [Actinomycetota bacterium]